MAEPTEQPAQGTRIASPRLRPSARMAMVLPVGAIIALGCVLIGSPIAAAVGVTLALGLGAALMRIGFLERALARMRWEDATDPLTGVLNRASFTRLATARLLDGRSGGHLVMAMIDLDDFGALNKLRGHLEGDRQLQMAASRLASAVGSRGLLGRLGGDEFAALIEDGDAERAGSRLLTALLTHAEPISASVGVTRVEEPERDWMALLREADVALRSAKRSGKSQVRAFSEAIDAHVGLERRRVEEVIEQGLFEAVVQPIVDIGTGRVCAYEALTRFMCDGPASPAHWLALAQSLGMGVELELACLTRSLELLDRLPEGTRLSVNLSALALGDSRTLQILRSHPCERLIVELTEGSLGRDLRRVRDGLEPLLHGGMWLAVDDMGTGYSNLRQVVELAPSLLKLDRTLVHGIDRDPAQRLLIDALTGYAQRTGAEIVAEGIETTAELEIVRGLGIAYGQGYLLAPPGSPWPKVDLQPHESPPPETGTLGSHPVTIAAQTTTDEARGRFVALPELESLVIVDDQRRPLGLITRHRLLSALGHRFGYSLWGERPVILIADRGFLCLPTGTPVRTLARKSLARPLANRHDPILLVDASGRLVAQVTISDMLLGGGVELVDAGDPVGKVDPVDTGDPVDMGDPPGELHTVGVRAAHD